MKQAFKDRVVERVIEAGREGKGGETRAVVCEYHGEAERDEYDPDVLNGGIGEHLFKSPCIIA